MTAAAGIAGRILDRARQGPGRPALTVGEETWTYGELIAAASALAARLPEAPPGPEAPATAVMVGRTAPAYLGVLAALFRGHAWAPVNVDHPPERNLAVLRKSGARQMICGDEAWPALERIFEAAPELAAAVEVIRCPELKAGHALDAAPPEALPQVPPDRRAYILFTSGSTGEPKGVPVGHGALTAYLDAVAALMPCGPDDRFSQTFELTFDLSIHDMMVCWTSGAHLFAASHADLACPAGWIRRCELTRWFSVPSLAFQMRLQGALDPGAFPSIRTSLFCGEALPARLAAEWAKAAPNGPVENWYGPTEATIACSRHVLPGGGGAGGAADDGHDLVPIGEAFPGMRLSVHRQDLSPAPDGEAGELLLSGPQLAEGYLDDPERTAKAFVTLPGEAGRFYRTGDRVVRDPGGPVRFLGRVDNQVKVRGFRIELGEIEAVLRAAAGGVNAVALSWPPDEPSGRYIVAAVEAPWADADALISACAERLPDYMVPARVLALPAFPRNASGKADRKGIAREAETLIAAAVNDPAVTALAPPARRLMEAVLAVSPSLSPRRILDSPSLMAAGMDSLSFISLTAEIERQWGRSFTQDQVVDLSLMPFAGLVAVLDGGKAKPPGGLARLLAPLKRLFARRGGGEGLSHRTNRSLELITAFPGLLRELDAPLVVAIGSSGTFRGLEPEAFEDEARRLGHAVACINAGLPQVSLTSLNRVARFVRDETRAAGARLSVALFELDPMHVSVLPPRRDLDLPEAFFSGEAPQGLGGDLDPEFRWSAPLRGAWAYAGKAAAEKRRPDWERARDLEVARTFAGDVEFVPAAIDAWLEGLRTISGAAERTFVFIHPASRAMLAELPDHQRGDRFAALMARIAAEPGVELIDWERFDLDDADFIDINHAAPTTGRPKLSRHLARIVLG